ncbi:hypothetical protein ACFL6K_00600 [Candidatus Latescibacterota bacterium]
MKMNHFGFLSVLSIVSALLFSSLLISGCDMQEIQSVWRDREVIINGRDEGLEWEKAKYFFEEKKVTLGLLNDEDYMYIRISSRDRSVQTNFMTTGFTLWIDPYCKKDKSFGLQFPVGIRSAMRNINSELTSEQDFNPEDLQKILDNSLNEIEIIGPGKKEISKMLLIRTGQIGINLEMNVTNGNMVYELKIPLLRNESNPYGIGTEKTDTIGIGLVAGNVEDEQMRNRIRRDDDGGMIGNGGSMGGVENGGGNSDDMSMAQRGLPGGARGGRVGMPSSGRTLDTLDMWLKIHLAKK